MHGHCPNQQGVRESQKNVNMERGLGTAGLEHPQGKNPYQFAFQNIYNYNNFIA
jgi:hypothetical protein